MIVRQRRQILYTTISEWILVRINIGNRLVSRFRPVLVTLADHSCTCLLAIQLRVDIVLVAFLVLAEDRLPIINAAVIRALGKHMLLQIFLSSTLLASKSRRGMEIGGFYSTIVVLLCVTV